MYFLPGHGQFPAQIFPRRFPVSPLASGSLAAQGIMTDERLGQRTVGSPQRDVVCMYACMHACMHACMYVCMYVYIYIYIYMYTHVSLSLYIYIYIFIHI